MTNIGIVIGWKHNHQEGMSTEDGVITKFPGGIPSQAEQDAWTTEYEAYVAANEYKGLRKAEYASLEEQADMKYWDEMNGTTTWKDHISAVKAKYPKA